MSIQKSKVSIQAFIEQVENWELTLNRERKKLKTLKTKIVSKILSNELDILITQIDGELIQYRKLKDTNKIQYIDIIYQYNESSKKFMEIMENVGNFADKVENETQLQPVHHEDNFQNQGKHNYSRQKYQDQTFTYTVSKMSRYHKVDQSPYRPHSKIFSKKSSFKNSERKNLNNKTLSNPPKHESSVMMNGKTLKNTYNKAAPNISLNKLTKNTEEFDSWEIKYQLKQIKSMIKQIQNEIKYHNHEDIEHQLGKVQHNNKKMTLEVKSLKEDSQFIMVRIQKLKDQLTSEKQIQTQMIEQFENPQRGNRKSKTKSFQQSRRNGSHEGDISEWVRIRI